MASIETKKADAAMRHHLSDEGCYIIVRCYSCDKRSSNTVVPMSYHYYREGDEAYRVGLNFGEREIKLLEKSGYVFHEGRWHCRSCVEKNKIEKKDEVAPFQ